MNTPHRTASYSSHYRSHFPLLSITGRYYWTAFDDLFNAIGFSEAYCISLPITHIKNWATFKLHCILIHYHIAYSFLKPQRLTTKFSRLEKRDTSNLRGVWSRDWSGPLFKLGCNVMLGVLKKISDIRYCLALWTLHIELCLTPRIIARTTFFLLLQDATIELSLMICLMQ